MHIRKVAMIPGSQQEVLF